MSYKFILDTNVLDEKSAKDLRGAGIIEKCRSRQFAFYATPILLKERLDFVTNGKIHPHAIEPVRLLVELEWQRLFNNPGGREGIYTMELEGKMQNEYLFIAHLDVKENLKAILNGGEFIEEAKKEIKGEKEWWAEGKTKNRETICRIREDVNNKLKNNPGATRKGATFKGFLEKNFADEAIYRIENSINSEIPKDKLIESWKKRRKHCPYFNKFIEGLLFMQWFPITSEQTPKIDTNAYEDIEHLVYLIGIDAIVSNEKSFIKNACKELFPNKDFLSVDEFAVKLKNS